MVALQRHPWFTIRASPRRSARPVSRSVRRSSTEDWCSSLVVRGEPSPGVLSLPVENGDVFDPEGLDVVFSATESDVAQVQEPRFAKTTPVVSTASAFRYETDVPLLVPNVNMEHAALIHQQRANRGWKGFVVPIPNCTVTGLVITLKPLAEAFGLGSVIVTSMNGLSGAGRSPGVMGLDVLDNLIPFIPNEEEKVQLECRKILPRHAARSAPLHAGERPRGPHRVGLRVARPLGVDRRRQARVRQCAQRGARAGLPTAPAEWIKVHNDPFRPQPRLDRDNGQGMTTTVGRVREDSVLPNGVAACSSATTHGWAPPPAPCSSPSTWW